MEVKNLYQFIHELVKKKERKLKIICDWDEVLKSREATVYYIIADKPCSFVDFFQKFWENVSVEYKGHICRVLNTNLEEVEQIRKKSPEEFQKKAKELSGVYPDFYNESPWLSIAEVLLKALREDLLEHFIVTGNYKKGRNENTIVTDNVPGSDPRKRIKFNESFGKFPNAKLEVNVPFNNEKGEVQLSRPEWIKKNHPDFDIFIDDNPNNIVGTVELFSSEESKKFFLLPIYETNKNIQGENIFYISSVLPTSLKDKDFVCRNNPKKDETKQESKHSSQTFSSDFLNEQQPQIQIPPK